VVTNEFGEKTRTPQLVRIRRSLGAIIPQPNNYTEQREQRVIRRERGCLAGRETDMVGDNQEAGKTEKKGDREKRMGDDAT
jgi:hypothetical protein